MTIIDTSVIIPFLNGLLEEVKRVCDMSRTNDQVEITIITAYELLKGAYLSSKREENLKDIKEVISSIQVLELSPEAFEEASKIFYGLRKSGKMISEFDILIAAIAKTNGEAILTHVKHFELMQGLDLASW